MMVFGCVDDPNCLAVVHRGVQGSLGGEGNQQKITSCD